MRNDWLDYLAHFRTPGSINGVRNYQYKDGSLTPEGRIHYGIGPPRKPKDKEEPPKNQITVTVNKGNAKLTHVPDTSTLSPFEVSKAKNMYDGGNTIKQISEQLNKSEEDVRAAIGSNTKMMTKQEVVNSGDYATIMKYKSQLSTSELQTAIARLEIEKRLASFDPKAIPSDPANAKKVSKGKEIIATLMDSIGKGIVGGITEGTKGAVAPYVKKAGTAAIEKVLKKAKATALASGQS